MQQCDMLILAEWCLPVEPDNRVLQDHAVVVDDGRIVEVLPTADARRQYSASVVIERPGHVLFPGLVNAHTHAAMTLFRGFGDDMPLERWLKDRIWPAEQRWVSAEMVRDGTRHAIAEMLLSGTTCFSDQYFFPEMVAEAAKEAQIRAMIGTPVVDFQTAWNKNGAECLSKGAELVHDRYADDPLISSCFAPHSTAAVSDDTLVALRIMSDQLDRRVQIHLHETLREVLNEEESSGVRPFERLWRRELINSSLTIIHGVHLSPAETEFFFYQGVSIVHCPRSNLKLASGIADVAGMLSFGTVVALGTDSAASNNHLDMLGEMQTATLLAKAVSKDASVLPACVALRMATINGARALGLADVTGSIEAGKWADLTCVDLRRLNTQPLYDPLSQLVYAADASQVTDVWVAGRHLVEGGRLTRLDVDEIMARSAEWQRRIDAG
jgi:5-methylthioadenosine/S-adenosylhomocysteine deaminase